MPDNLKGLIVVLAIGAVIFRLAKPIAVRFSDESNFCRRRNVWLLLTATAFLSPNFWLFALVAVPLLTWAGRKDTNPIAFYLLMLHVIPPVSVDIPAPGLNTLFPIDNYRLLSLCVLIPTAWRLLKSKDAGRNRGIGTIELSLLAFGAMQILLFVPPDLPSHIIIRDSFTNDLRVAFLYSIDVYVLYIVVSRSLTTRYLISEALAAFCLATSIMAAIAIFETFRHWLLYFFLGPQWTATSSYYYLLRQGAVRAQASAGDPLTLGYLLAIGFGFWLFLQSQVQSRRLRISVVALYLLGLFATYGRGPWVGAGIIYFAFVFLGPRALPRLFKVTSAAVLVAFAIGMSPLADRVVNMIPFMAHSVDTEASSTVLYRQRLAARAFELIEENPFFGNQMAFSRMEDLRQGQGIIDLVNAYVEIALFYGVVGLFVFVYPMLSALSRAYWMARSIMRTDHEFAQLGITLSACITGTLVMLATSSFQNGYAKMFYVLAALAVAYANLGRSVPQRGSSRGPIGRRIRH